MTNVEEVLAGLTEERVIESESVPTSVTIPPQTETVPSASLMGQEESTNPKDTQSGSSIVMMPSTGVSEQSPTIGLIGTTPPAVEVLPTQVLSLSSSERLDYSGDLDWDNVRCAPDSTKFSHLTVEKGEIISTEGKLWFHCIFLCTLYGYFSDIFPFGTFFKNSGGRYQRGDY